VGDPHRDPLALGSSKLKSDLVERLYPYDLTRLTSYDSAYLAGWHAQAYDIPLKPAWEVGKRRMRERAKDACYASIPSSHVRNFSMAADLNQERWRYVLLPVYTASYTFQGEIYRVLVNGQTGAIAGQKPVSWQRVWLAIAAALAPGVLAGLVGLLTMPLGGLGAIVLPVAFVLFLVGLIASIYIFIRAREADQR
jgi:hypothetical protein